MARPIEYENLSITSVSAQKEQLVEAKRLGLNLSKIFRKALSDALANPEKKKKHKAHQRFLNKFRKVPRPIMNKAYQKVSFHPASATKYANELNLFWDTKLTYKDLLKYAVVYRNNGH